MRTLLSKYCEELERALRPVIAPLGETANALSTAQQEVPGRELHGEIVDLQHQVEALAQKVAEQQAYVLIFGPLKSGKSTLMNAICGQYVSEVSSLPAYPCMVYVSHSERRVYNVTRYGGKKEVFRKEEDLHALIDKAHTALAQRLREVEAKGEDFEPKTHFPQAIRRIDVNIPTGNLGESGAVLVDTPGLYSRMKFGYDRMTREFRNAAACAIFVVRSDNLFLEQVFAEFNQLLELFSRVFLVVNLDTTKRDLRRDGRLVPSLEQSDPRRIIQAFETLAMSGPLKSAAEAGRLQIFPVGLLDAASKRLAAVSGISLDPPAKPGGTSPKQADKPTAKSTAKTTAKSTERSEPQSPPDDGFETFESTLNDYLNSTEYMVAFLRDSLRRANTLLEESCDLTSHPSVHELRAKIESLQKLTNENDDLLAEVARLEAHGWDASLQRLQNDLGAKVGGLSKSVEQKTASAMDGALGNWFKGDHGLIDLVDAKLRPLLIGYQDEMRLKINELLEQRMQQGNGGLDDVAPLEDAFANAKVELDGLARAAYQSIDRTKLVASPAASLSTTDVPIRRRLIDWLLFRPKRSLQERILGTHDRPAKTVPADVKAKRIGAKGLAEIQRRLTEYRKKYFVQSLRRLQRLTIGQYAAHLQASIASALGERRVQLEARQAELKGTMADHLHVMYPIESLRQRTLDTITRVEELSTEYGDTAPEDLQAPVILPRTAPDTAATKSPDATAPAKPDGPPRTPTSKT